MTTAWTADEIEVLRSSYPRLGQAATASLLGRSNSSIRTKASKLGLKLEIGTEFWNGFQARAARSKVGRKRPEQSLVMKRSHAEGKLKKTPEQRKAMGERTKKWIKQNGHPRGALGMKHSAEALQKISAASLRKWQLMTPEEVRALSVKRMKARAANGTNVANRKRGSWKAGWREVGGIRKYFRSRWEVNYARFLEWQRQRGDILKWEHEPETFWFEGVKRGCVSYLPDFRVTTRSGIEYHEVKGWMDAGSKTKIKRMKKYYPNVKLVIVDAPAYRSLARLFKLTIPGWES